MHDIRPQDQPYWNMVRMASARVLTDYGFERIDTPLVEPAELFLRAVGASTEVIEKQMYLFKTRGGDLLALRPEITASVVRAYIEHGMHTLPQPIKLWYNGPVFRHEAPGAGRYRQFWQIGVETLGDESAVLDAEAMQALYALFQELKLSDVMIHINSIGDAVCRPNYRKSLVAYYRTRREKLCKDCKRRLAANPLRLLDCKEPGCQELRREAPQIVDYLCQSCHAHFREVIEFLDEAGLPYMLDPYLVRGLDYYTRTVFEYFLEGGEGAGGSYDKSGQDLSGEPRLTGAGERGNDDEQSSDKNGQDSSGEPLPTGADDEDRDESRSSGLAPQNNFAGLALGGGGRYDGLAELLGGKPTPAVGWAAGIERIIEALRLREIAPRAGHLMPLPRVFLAQLGDLGKRKALKLFEELRRAGIPTAQAFSKDSLKAQLRIASRLGSTWTLILGQKEALDGMIIVREMSSGIQEMIGLDKVVDELKKKPHKQ
jgi:histidyl-tRNA synthetase